MINKLNNKKHLVILATILLVFFVGLSFAQSANAEGGWLDLILSPTQMMNEILETFVSDIMAPFLNFFADGLQWATALSTTMITDNDQIIELWGLIRDLVNLFFVLALLIIAFGTIFDTAYGAKHTLFKLLIVALLINFSYVIGAMVIEFSNIMTSAFLGSIGNPADLGSRIAQSLQPGSVYPDGTVLKELTAIQGGVEVAGRVLSSLVFAVIFMALSIVAMAVGFLLILMRIPILWAILIFAPVAWAGMIFPQTEKQTWGAWWKSLIEWSFVLPVYMFFVFLGVFFMNNAVFTQEQTQILESFTLTDQFLNLMSRSIGRLFQFALSIFFLLGGAFAAKKICGEAGSYAGKAQDWVTGKIRSGATGTAVGTAWKQFKETGQVGKYQIGGGERAKRLRQAYGQNIVDPGAYEKQRSAEVETQVNALKARKAGLSEDAWEKEVASAEKGGGVNSLAMKQLLAEEGRTVGADGQIKDASANDVVNFMQQNKGDRNPVAQKYLKAMQDSGAIDKFDNTEVEDIVKGDNAKAKNMLQLRQVLGKATVKGDPKRALGLSGSLLKLLPPGKERMEYLGSVDWGKAMGAVKSADKARAITQIQSMQGAMDGEETKVVEKMIKESNPALWAESKGEDVDAELTQRLKTDNSEEMKKYIKNVYETNFNEIRDLITSMPDEDFNTLVKGQSREFREQLKFLRP